eukprot:Rhum_TRINITY_DN18853_c0_g1::Rhum_TRINITY_DN18853_c0_g1_i1::g.168571::m.168571
MTDTHQVHLRVQPASNVRTDTVAAGHLPLRLQLVWMWRTDGANTAKGQTKIAEVTETGDVDISGSWDVPSVTDPTNASLHQLSLALFAYPAEAASGTNVGMGTVSLGDVTANPSFEFELLTKGVINQNVRLSFSVAFGSQPQEKEDETPAAAAAAEQAAAPAPQEAHVPAPEAAPAPAQPAAAEALSAPAGAEQQKAPAGDDEPTPPAYDDGVADSRVSTSELRVWIADVVSEIREGLTEPYNRSNKFASEGAASLPPQQEAFAVRAGPVPWGESVMCVLDDPILRTGHAATRKTMPTVVVEELLLSSVLEVYLNATQWGPEVALAIRQETGQKLLSLLHLPETTSHRVHTDNGMATSAAMQQVQRFGLLKANNADTIEEIETMKARQLVVYIGDETYAEWETCEIVAQLRFDVPMLTLRRVKLAEEGSIDLAMLEGAIREDEARGSVPVAVVGRMGNLGKAGMDDMAALGGICTQHHMWLHVEGPGVFCLHSSGSASVNAAAGALRQSVGSGRLNVSVTLCLHEVPGFRNLQGFWVFSSGPHGAIVPPQERSPESDIASLRYCLPAYMRLRTVGLQQAFDTLSQRIGDAERLLEGIGQLNEPDAHGKSPAVVVKLHTHASNPWMVLFTFLPFDHPLVLHDAHAVETEVNKYSLSIARINDINTSVHAILDDGSFGLVPEQGEGAYDDGLVRWQVFFPSSGVQALRDSLAEAQQAATQMVQVSRVSDAMAGRIEKIAGLSLQVIDDEGRQATDLCAFRVSPSLLGGPDLAARDVAELAQELAKTPCGDAFSLQQRRDVVVLCSCASHGAAVPDAAALDASAAAIERRLGELKTSHAVALRREETALNEEAIQKGIELAQQQLEKAKQEEASVLSSIPLVGGFLGWMAPAPVAGEGLTFDLKTSTMNKIKDATTQPPEN